MRRTDDILRDLRRISTDAHRCFGCGREHNCSLHGCAIIREASDLIRHLSETLRESEAARSDLGKRLAAAQQGLHEAKSELDTLLADLHNCSDACAICANMNVPLLNEACEGECSRCKLPCTCSECDEKASNFVWRGMVVQ